MLTVKVNGTSHGLVHKGSMHFAKSTAPDVCKTPSPGGPIPIPYPIIISMASDLANGTTTVKADGGQMIGIKGCEYSMCTGDEPGTAGGVVSNTFKKEAKFILFSFDVKMDGNNACRQGDKMTMNHQNTVCMGGTTPTEVSPGDVKALLDKIAEDCNRAENTKAGHCPQPPGTAPTGEQCKTLGTKKHKCCEKKLKARAAETPPPSPPIHSEVPFSSPGNQANAATEALARSAAGQAYQGFIAAAAPGGGAAALKAARALASQAKVWAKAYFSGGGAPFRADVLVGSPPTNAYDFKFNCKPKVKMSAKQIGNYVTYTGLAPEPIHVDGSTC
jgi:hypothetical protein